ncbi:hypothetical protein RhiXN_09483 [Rhizoctonia solani]|uniref:Uncharacterized protein n=1 Tax=Rhizoctonia solani TaxID=456999 RepID=A0A8H8SX95_9AGAM|nr:uncharacterized protein RhiXN_09483 [Rhizoctonia solani]QRW21896.1 hypothetical protein RhiXN_09483 [Rhizoctonia solani]
MSHTASKNVESEFRRPDRSFPDSEEELLEMERSVGHVYKDMDPIEMWPRAGLRPDWWPLQSAGEWPFEKSEEDYARVVSADEELLQLIKLLTTRDTPHERSTNLAQLAEWEIALDGGQRPTRKKPEQGGSTPSGESGETSSSQVKRRKVSSYGRTNARWKR